MRPSEVREMTDDELFERLDELERALFNMKIQHATGQLDTTARLKLAKRDLARVKTIIKERGL
jgi:large subunit ribosomal protein L29